MQRFLAGHFAMLASLDVAALLLGLLLKVVDKKKGIGLEEPNIKA